MIIIAVHSARCVVNTADRLMRCQWSGDCSPAPIGRNRSPIIRRLRLQDTDRQTDRQQMQALKACTHCRRFRRQSPFSRRFWRQSHFSATVAVFGDSVDRLKSTCLSSRSSRATTLQCNARTVSLRVTRLKSNLLKSNVFHGKFDSISVWGKSSSFLKLGSKFTRNSLLMLILHTCRELARVKVKCLEVNVSVTFSLSAVWSFKFNARMLDHKT